MAIWDKEEAKEFLFRILFVMRDSPNHTREALRNTIIIFTIDMFQVFRTLLSPVFGWSGRTFEIARWIDVVQIGDILVSAALPRVSLFVFSFVMVFVAVGDAIYCGTIFRAGEIRSMVPIKLLRFLVTLVVVTLYSSTIKWLLMPIECLLVAEHNHLNEVLDGEDSTECTPWTFPYLAITLSTLVLVVLYVSFATTACYFSLGVNAVSESARCAYTGRVEVWFFAVKVAITFAPFIAKHTSLALSPIVVLLCALRTLYMHHTMHPFQSHVVNCLRGGAYCSIIWLALWSIILCGLAEVRQQREESGQGVDGRVQHAEWVGVGMVPLVFALGVFLVDRKRAQVFATLEGMKEAFEMQKQHDAEAATLESPVMSVRAVLKASLNSPTRRMNQPGSFFFRANSKKRWFRTGRAAVTAARVQLRRREGARVSMRSWRLLWRRAYGSTLLVRN